MTCCCTARKSASTRWTFYRSPWPTETVICSPSSLIIVSRRGMVYLTGNFADTKFRRKFLAMGVGNVMEWYDFAIFGALADVIGAELFPSDTASKELLKGLAVFGAAFLMRPLGGIVMGRIGDTVGRKKALEVSIALMLLPSFFIGCLPSYQVWGLKTTILLIILRLMQGLAVGGELVGAYIYTIEATGGKDRGFWGAMCKASGNLGTTLGMGVSALLRHYLSKQDLYTWGWRVPFLSGILFGVIGIWLRSKLDDDEGVPFQVDEIRKEKISESASLLTSTEGSRANNSVQNEVFSWLPSKDVVSGQIANTDVEEIRNPLMIDKKAVISEWSATDNQGDSAVNKTPTLDTMNKNWRELLLVAFVASFWCCSYYTSFVWIMYFTGSSLVGGDGVPSAWLINFLMNCALVCLFPLGGALGDLAGKLIGNEDRGFCVLMQLGTVVMIITAVPAFGLIATRTIGGAILGQSCLLVAVALFGSNLPAFMVSQFPIRNRYSGIGIAYNVAHAIFSGTAPIVQTALVLSSPGIAAQSSSQDPSLHPHLSAYYLRNDGRLRPAFYMVLVSIISLLALTFGVPYCEKKRKIIEDILTTEAAIEAAFEIEIITPDCEKDVEEEQVEEDDEEGTCPEGYVQVDSSDSSHHRMILSV